MTPGAAPPRAPEAQRRPAAERTRIPLPVMGTTAPAPSRPRTRRQRTFRATDARLLSQIFFFALFGFVSWITWFSRLGGYPVSLFLEVDPLVAVATALSTRTVYRALAWSLVLIVPTLVLGRFFCNWVCPYGTLHQFMAWAFARTQGRNPIELNRYRPMFRAKYVLLAFLLALAAM